MFELHCNLVIKYECNFYRISLTYGLCILCFIGKNVSKTLYQENTLKLIKIVTFDRKYRLILKHMVNFILKTKKKRVLKNI